MIMKIVKRSARYNAVGQIGATVVIVEGIIVYTGYFGGVVSWGSAGFAGVSGLVYSGFTYISAAAGCRRQRSRCLERHGCL